ncbi:MAG: IPExxxVDY family protein [Cytophagaceae bacterium]
MKSTRIVVDFDYDYQLLGIISSAKEYKLAWWINKILEVNLSKISDIQLEFQRDGGMYHSCYLHETAYSQLRLIRNKSHEFTNIAKPFLVPEYKEYDYLVHICGEGDIFDLSEIQEKLTACPVIQYSKVIQVSDLKSKDNLIFN